MTMGGGGINSNGPFWAPNQQVFAAQGPNSTSLNVTTVSECGICSALVLPIGERLHTQTHLQRGESTPFYTSASLVGPPGPPGPMGMSGDITPELRELVMDVMKHMRGCDKVADDFMAEFHCDLCGSSTHDSIGHGP